MGVEQIVVILIVLLAHLLLMLHFWGTQQVLAVRRLKTYFQKEIYPGKELAPELREAERKAGRSLRMRDRAGLRVTPEAERGSAFFARTSQYFCDARRKGGPEDSWYQEEDWIRDIVASVRIDRGEMEDEDLT